MNEAIKNITESPKSSFKAVLLAIFAAAGTIGMHLVTVACSGAATTFAATGNVTDWKPYAIAAVVAIGTFLGGGGLRKDIEPVKEAIAEAIPFIPAMFANPIIDKVGSTVAQAGINLMITKVNEKLGTDQPALALAITQALSAHAEVVNEQVTTGVDRQTIDGNA
jgi:hypothetical protein